MKFINAIIDFFLNLFRGKTPNEVALQKREKEAKKELDKIDEKLDNLEEEKLKPEEVEDYWNDK